MLNDLQLTGRERTHINQLEAPRCALHHDVVEPFMTLRAAAARDGIDLTPCSSFRDFDSQLRIWNRKFRGEWPLYDAEGAERDYDALDEEEIVECILCWSALPGASRHHWGTEIDVIDGAAVPEGYRVQLLPEEFASDGVFGKLARWLGEHIEAFGFFRPYASYQGGVHAEPWHLSYAPVSVPALEALGIEVVREAVAESILGREIVLKRLPEIYERYVLNIVPPPGIEPQQPA